MHNPRLDFASHSDGVCMNQMIEEIKELVGSNSAKGWPVAVRDRIAYPAFEESIVTDANVSVAFLWTMRDAVLPKLEKQNLAIASNFYTPAGLQGMARNILANPFIRYMIIFGEEYSSRERDEKVKELTSAGALRAFFEKGINGERRVYGFESSVYFDKHIPTELIKKLIESVELIDLNARMPNATLEEKIAEANRLLKTLPKKPPFLEKPMVFDYEKTADSFPFEGGPLMVRETTIPKAWIEMIYTIYRYGRKNLMNANTDRWVKEINDMIVVIHDPQNTDLSLNPFLVPLTKEKIEAYKKEILSPLLPAGKAYTYGNKLRAYYFPNAKEIKELVNSKEFKDFEFGQGAHLDANIKYLPNGACEINQIQDIIDALKRDAYSKACVAITWHVQEELMRKHKSSPCLVFLQAIVQDEKLNLTVFFRSHDMTQGWPENAYGCAAIQKEIADAIGMPTGILTIMSGSAQIYSHYNKQVEEMLAKYRKPEINYRDAKGNYIIQLLNGKIVVTHLHPETNSELDKFEGKTALELYPLIASKGFLNADHALYLGMELQKAELALQHGLKYMQDQSLVFGKKSKNRF